MGHPHTSICDPLCVHVCVCMCRLGAPPMLYQDHPCTHTHTHTYERTHRKTHAHCGIMASDTPRAHPGQLAINVNKVRRLVTTVVVVVFAVCFIVKQPVVS